MASSSASDPTLSDPSALAPRADAPFQTLADVLPTLAWTAGPDGAIDWYNARWYAYTGTTPEEMAGWGWQRVHDPAVLPAVLERWRASIATGAPFEMTFPLRGADGGYRDFLTRVAPVRDVEGRVVRWFGTNTDLTPERAAAAEREGLLAASEAARAELAAANAQLQEQGLELELANQQLQEQAAELEAQAEELQATAAHLEEQVEAADRATAAHRHSEERYALAARATSNAIWDWDLTTDALAWNEGLFTLFGIPPGTVPAGSTADGIRFWVDHIHPDDRDRVVAGIHRVIDDPAGGSAWRDAYRFRRGDGTYAEVVDRGFVARQGAGEGGRATRMIGAMEDVSAARAAEAARAASEARYRTLFASIDEGFCVIEILLDDAGQPTDYRFIEANPAFEVQTGLAEPVGHTIRELVPDIEPHWIDTYGVVARTGEPVRFRQGSAVIGRWFDVYAFRVGAPDASGPDERRVALLFSDVSAAHRAEAERDQLFAALEAERARLSDVIRLAPAFMAVLRGPDHRFELTNAQYDRLVGGREVRGRPVAEALPEAARQGFVALLDRVLATGEPFVGRELPYRRPDATGAEDERYVDFVYQPLAEADGARAGVLVHGVDVTDQVRARRAAERLLAEAEAARTAAEDARRAAETANATKGLFLANMSHELRTPLNAIGGYVQLLDMGLHGPVTDDQRGALARVRGAQRHLLALINDILNYAKLESGRVEYDVRAVDVAEVVRDVAPLVEPQVRARGLTFDVQQPETPCVVWADREKLGQVLVNLLSNAVKFTPSPDPATGAPGRVTVSVAAREAGPNARPDLAFVRVQDTGIGIVRDKQAGIFEPFVQVRSGYAQATEGTGLGLAISRDLARGMGGDLRVRSAPGEGATFTVALRRVVAADGQATDRRVGDERRDDDDRRTGEDRREAAPPGEAPHSEPHPGDDAGGPDPGGLDPAR